MYADAVNISSDKSAGGGSAAPEADSWRRLPIPQQPHWSDREALHSVLAELSQRPALVEAPDCERLRDRLAAVARGEAFLLHAGDCAETFAESDEETLDRKLRTLTQMALILEAALGVEVVLLGRMAGQFAKPRSHSLERRGNVALPVYRGDAVNGLPFTATARSPEPTRLLRAYDTAADIVRHSRRFAADFGRHLPALIRDIEDDLGAVTDTHLFRNSANAIPRSTGTLLQHLDIFFSHESLLLEFESALLRRHPALGPYASSAHLLWIGDRTRAVDGAHVEFARSVGNPIAVKLGPSAEPNDVRALAERLNPDGLRGRLTFITRMGAALVRDRLPALISAMRDDGVSVGWLCDPMHGNTRRTSGGYKTRDLAAVLAEMVGFFEVHRALGSRPGGLHLEMTGDAVTECVGGSNDVSEADLPRRYRTACDPRLNREQSLDLALWVADIVAQGGWPNPGPPSPAASAGGRAPWAAPDPPGGGDGPVARVPLGQAHSAGSVREALDHR